MMKKNMLIAYYTHSANTYALATLIERETGGALCELLPEKPYPRDYQTVVEQAKKEITAGFRPALKTIVENIKAYDTIFVGTPNWWNTIAPPLATFLDNYDLSEKTIVPFCTHGGGGSGQIEAAIRKSCPHSMVLPLLSVYGDTATEAQVKEWLKKLGEKA